MSEEPPPQHHAHDFGYGPGVTRWLLEGESDTCQDCETTVKREEGVLVITHPAKPDEAHTRPLG